MIFKKKEETKEEENPYSLGITKITTKTEVYTNTNFIIETYCCKELDECIHAYRKQENRHGSSLRLVRGVITLQPNNEQIKFCPFCGSEIIFEEDKKVE